MKLQWIKKTTALILLVTFPLTQSGWSAESIQMISGQPQAVADPFTDSTNPTLSEPEDFLALESPLSAPEQLALPNARIVINSTAGLTASSVTTLGGSPRPYVAEGSTSETSLRVSAANVVAMNHQASTESDFSGVNISFDNASTSAIETRSIGALSQITVGLKGETPVVRMQIEDVNGKVDEIDLNGVSASVEKFWRISVASISSTLDKTKIKSIRFLVSPSNGGSNGSGELMVRVNGMNLAVPTTPVVVPAAPTFANQGFVTLSGTKEAHTAILINGVEIVPPNGETAWTAQVALPLEGANALKITAKNSIGKISAIRSVTISKDTIGPAGTININSGATYATSRTVTLRLSAVDTKGSGVGTMSFSTDGRNWSAPEAYKTSKSFVLPEGDGVKTVYVKYFDKVGNESMSYFKTIVLDLLPPSGTMIAGEGSGFVNSRNVVLNLNAQDLGAGLSKMSFSHNGSTWTTAENYAQTKSWTLTAGDGAKKVYVKFQDKAGKWSSPVLVNVTLDTVKPAGTININSGASLTNSQSIILNLSASDVGGGVGSMSFSTDNVNWTPVETYTASKSFELSSGDGNKTVFVKYFDKAGNASAVYSKSVMVDANAPVGSLTINQGNSYTDQSAVMLNLSAQDAGTGVTQMRFSNDGVNWSVAEVFSTVKSWVLAAGEGLKTVFVKFMDAVGNWSQVISSQIFMDTAAPVGSVSINSGAVYTKSQSVTLSFDASDSGSGVEKMSFSADWMNWSPLENFASEKTFTLPSGDGYKTIYVRYYDKSGKSSAVYTHSIILDTTAPSIAATSQFPALTNNPNLTVSYTVDGVAKQKSFNLVEGNNNLSITETDLAGNSTTLNLPVVMLDTTAPTISVTSAIPALTKNSNLIVDYIVDGATIQKSFNLVEGNNSLSITETDLAGNSTTLNLSPVSLDTVAPVVAVASQIPALTNNPNITVSYTVDGVAKQKSFNLAEGSNDLSITETDLAGNPTAVNLPVIVLDTVAPAILITSQVPALTSSSVLVVDYTVDGAIKQKSFVLTEGVNHLLITETDLAGNQSSTLIQVDYQTSWNLNIAGGGFQHFEDGVLQYQVGADGSRIDFDPSGAIAHYSFGSDQANAKALLLDDAQNTLEIRSTSGQLLKTISGLKPAAPDLTSALKVNLQNGMEAYYINGILKEIRTATGIRLFDLILSSPVGEGEEPEILDAVIGYPNGSFEILWNKQLVRKISSEGVITDVLPSGKIGREVSETVEQTYVEIYSAQGVFSGTKIISNLGDVIIYDEKGILREVRGHDGKQFIYDRALSGTSFVIRLNTTISSLPSDHTLKSGQYKNTGEVVTLEFQNGSQITFENGQVKTAVDSGGAVVDYSPLLANGFAQGLAVARDETTFQYDQSGFLNQIQTQSGTIIRERQDTNNDGVLDDEDTVKLLLEWAGAYKLTDFELDGEGKILNGVIETREGIKQKIENGVLKEFETADGRRYIVENQEARLEEWKFKDGLVVKYGGVGISEILFPDGKKLTQIGLTSAKEIEKYTEIAADGSRKFYESGWLVKSINPEGIQILYGVDHRANKVILADGVEKFIEHQFDASGDWVGLKIREGNSVFTYDADAELTNVLVSGLYADIEDGEIQKVFTRFGEVSAPSWNEQNQLEGEIVLTDGRKLTLSNGSLSRVVMPNGSVIDYQSGRISRVENSEGIYNLVYEIEGDQLRDVKVNWTLKSTEPVVELVTETIPIIPDGNVRLASDVSPFGSYLSLDGSGDYMTVSESPDWNIGSQDFTLDFWVNPERSTGDMPLVSLGGTNNFDIMLYGELSFYFGDGGYFNTGVRIPFGEWHHVAVVRSGNILKVYLDGKQVGQNYDVSGRSISNVADGFYLGYRKNHNVYFAGALDEVRLSTGARWISNFAPPEQEYGVDPNTLFLKHFNQLSEFNSKYDGQLLNVQTTAVNAIGNATVDVGAALFDGMGDYLKIQGMNGMSFGANDFTIESRVKVDTGNQGTQTIVAEYADGGSGWIFLVDPREHRMMLYRDGWTRAIVNLNSGTQFSSSVWNDVAVVRVGNKIKFFLNGVQQGADYDVSGWVFNGSGSNFQIGQYGTHDSNLKGAMDSIRISKGIARYTSNYMPALTSVAPDAHTLLLHHFDALNPAQSVPSTVIVSFGGDAKIYTPQAVFGDAAYFDGNGDVIKSYDADLLNFGTGDFTIDFRANFESIRDGQFQTFFSRENASDIRMARDHDNNLQVYMEGQYFNFGQFKPQANRWYHFALVRKNGILKLYVDGMASNAGIASNQNMQGTAPLHLGVIYNSDYFYGMMEEFRVSDVARWSANFVPPAEAYQVDKNTKFLHHFDDFGRAESGHEIKKYGIVDAGETFQGAVTQLASNAKLGNAGLGFSAANQTFVKVPDINLKGSDYTLEGWFQAASSTLSGAGIFGQQNQNVTNYAGLYVDWDGKLTYEIRRNSQNLITLKVGQSINYSQKHHFAVVKDGNAVKIFVDGALAAQGAVADQAMPDFDGVDFTLGKYSFAGYTSFYGWTGSVDEFRISDRARYNSSFAVASQAFEVDQNTLFLHHGEGQGVRAGVDFKQPSGEMSLSRYLLDNPDSEFAQIIAPRSVENVFANEVSYVLEQASLREMTVKGDVKVSTDGQKFKFDGNGDGLTLDGANLDFGSGDFTLEAKVRFDALGSTQTIVADYAEGGVGWIWTVDTANNQVLLYDSGWNPLYFSMPPLQVGVFYEMSIVRKGNQIMFFRDGVMYGGVQTPRTSYVGSVNKPLQVGYYDSVSSYLNGWMDRLRITKGVGRYVANYTVSESYVRDSNTEVLLNFTSSEFNQKHETALSSEMLENTLGKIDLFNLTKDLDRGNVTGISGIYDPNEKEIANEYWNRLNIERNNQQTASDHIPGLQNQLIDMDGDGDLDRIYALTETPEYWLIQRFENGQFLAPEKWAGTNLLPAGLHYNQSVLRFYEGRHPVVIGDLVDINGDNRPDRLMVSVYGEPGWYVQINNGQGFDAAEMWTDTHQPISQWNYQATYALRVRDDAGHPAVQPLIADLIDLDGDGLLDRVVRPLASPTPGANPYDHWFFQKNNGHGFDDALIWEGVDFSFDAEPKIGSSLSWSTFDGNMMADTADVIDMNGDNLPDRILLKPKTAGRPDLGYAWYIQFNNGHGFDASVIWDDSVRSLPGVSNAGIGTAIRAFAYGNHDRSYGSFLADVTGDGLPDRITLDSYGASPAPRWWVEENTGVTFKPAVAWEGIEGTTVQEISPTQDNENFVSYTRPGHIAKTSSLVDMNNDGKLDRVILKQGSDQWSVQYGTGSGFLPSKPMVIQSVQSEAITDHYDYVHISLRSDDASLSQQGKVVVKLLDANNAIVQTWDISKPGSGWKDHYLKLDASKANGRYLSMEWQFDTGVSPSVAPQILVEDVGLTAFRPDASLEWLDYLLTDAALVDQVHAAANDSLISKLGGLAGAAGAFDWKTLLSADKLITFNAEGAIAGTEKLNGETTTVVESTNGSTVTTTRLDGTVTQTTIPSNAASSSLTQTIVNDNGTPNDITDDYTETATIAYDRIRSVTRENENKQPLQYSYEFDSLGREVTAIYDPDSKTTEKYRVFETPNGKESKLTARIDANGVETRFEYDERARLTASVIYYKGRERERFTHLEAGNNQSSVRLDNGTVETYDSQGRILSHTTIEGYTYTHEFAPQRDAVTTTQSETFVICDPAQDDCSAIPVNERTLTFDIPYIELVPCTLNCEEIHRVSLDSFTDLNGNRATYDGSQVATVSLKDGTVVLIHSWVESVDSETSERSYLPKEVTVIHADGSVTEFKNGKPFSVATSSGREISIAPDLEASTSERTVLINPSSAAEFHHAEALKLWNDLVLIQVKKFTPPSDLPVETEYTKQGVVLNRLFAEGSRQIFDAEGKLTDIYAESGAAWVHYDYDQDGKLIDIDLDGSRRDLDLRASELRAQMAVEKQKALSLAAEREQVLNETIEGEYLVQRDRLFRLKSQVEAQRSKLISIPARGSARGMIAGAMNQIQAGLAQINRALTQLAEQRAQSLADVSQAARDLKAQIEAEANAGMADIAVKEAEIQRNILKQEISPVVFEWYRSVLGRHPSDVEYDAEVAQANYATGSFDVAALKARLEASPEKAVRLAEVNAIKTAVRNQLQSYLAMTAEQKTAYQSSLGLADYTGFIVNLSDAEAQKILTWLDGGSLHFGQSAFIALEAMLDDADVTHNRIDLARDLIIMDILTGTITELETGDLVLSMFSLNLYAKRFGLNLSSLELNWDSLKALVVSLQSSVDAQKRVIAHIDGNHYIIITNITTRVVDGKTIEEVHYTDPGAGPESDLDQLVLSKEDFLETWTAKKLQVTESGENRLESLGYILAPRAPPVPVSPVPGTVLSFRTLTTPEQMQIRGAFFPLIIAVVAAVIGAIISAVATVVSAIIAIIAGVIAAVSAAIGGLFTFVGTLFGSQFLIGVGAVFQGFSVAVANFGAALIASTLPTTIASSFVYGLGISYGLQGVGSILNAIGVSPKITGTLIAGGKLIGGLVLTASGAGAGLGLSLIGSGTTDLLSLHTNLSSSAISMIGLGAQVLGAFAGGFGGPGGFSWADGLALLKTSIPSLAMDLSATGIEMLGSSLGWDPRLTGLISIPVSAVVGGVARGLTQGDVVVGYRNGDINSPIYVTPAGGVMDYVNLGLNQSLKSSLSYGVNLGLEAAGVNGQAGSMLLSALSGFATAAGIGGTAGGVVGTATDWAKNLLGGIAETAKKFGSAIVKGAQTVISFGQKLIEGVGTVTKAGFQKVAGFFSGLFSRETSENIYKDQAGLLGGTVTQDGSIWTYTAGDSRIIYDSSTGNVREELISGGRTVQFEGLGEDSSGGIYYQKLTYAQVTQGGGVVRQEYQSGELQSWTLNQANGQSIHATTHNGALVVDQNGRIVQGDVKVYQSVDIQMPRDPQLPDVATPISIPFPVVMNFVVFGNQVIQSNVTIQPVIHAPEPTADMLNEDLYALVSGFNNDKPWAAPAYLFNYERDMVRQSQNRVGMEDIVLAPGYYANLLLKVAPYVLSGVSVINDIKDAVVGLVAGKIFDFFKDIFEDQVESTVENALEDALQKIWDSSDLIRDVIDEANPGPVAQRIIRSLENYFDYVGDEHRERDMIAVGYSGGFAPLIEVLRNSPYDHVNNVGYNPVSVVAIGAANKIAEAAQQVVDAMMVVENQIRNLKEKIRDHADALIDAIDQIMEDADRALTLGFGSDLIGLLRQSIIFGDHNTSLTHLIAIIKDFASKIAPIELPDLAIMGDTKLMVNVYGTKDLMLDLPIIGVTLGGHRTEMAGFSASITERDHPLVNIEIVGANHTDYMRQGFDFNFDNGLLGVAAEYARTVEDRAWNERVANFVADLTLNSHDETQLIDFLSFPPDEHSVRIENHGDRWVVYLPGSGLR